MENYLEARTEIQNSIIALCRLMDKELSQDWKSYTITIEGRTHELLQDTLSSIRYTVIKTLIKDAVTTYVERIGEDIDSNAFEVIDRIFSGARKEDHQFEIYKEEVVSNLDEDGKPITAKPLNEDNVLVQWQNQNRFQFQCDEEEEDNGTNK